MSCESAKFFADGVKVSSYGLGLQRFYYLPRKKNWAKPSNLLSKRKNRTFPYKYYDQKKKNIKHVRADLSFKEQLLDLY
jgi:hypothetical protein